jgi:hypothetical protein
MITSELEQGVDSRRTASQPLPTKPAGRSSLPVNLSRNTTILKCRLPPEWDFVIILCCNIFQCDGPITSLGMRTRVPVVVAIRRMNGPFQDGSRGSRLSTFLAPVEIVL